MKTTRFLVLLAVIGIMIGCGSNRVISDSSNTTLSALPKKPIRVLVVSEGESVLHIACKEAFGTVFMLVSSPPYDMKVISSFKKYEFKTISEICKGPKGNIECNGRYRFDMNPKIEIYDAKDILQFDEENPVVEEFETWGMALNVPTAKSRAFSAAAGNANTKIASEAVVGALQKFYESPQMKAIESEAKVAQERAGGDKINPTEKLPIECLVYFPPDVSSIKATAFLNRGIVVNKERQSGTVVTPIGDAYTNELLTQLQGRFASVVNMTAGDTGRHSTYNPNSLACYLEVKIDQPEVEGNQVKIPAEVTIKTPTGGIYKTLDASGKGAVTLTSTGGQMLGEIATGFAPFRALFEGTILEKALKNGCEVATRKSVEKVIMVFQPSFAKSYAEYSSYDSARSTQSLTDMKSFLHLYPNSTYRQEIESKMDEVAFKSAQSSNSLELYVDYLRLLPSGKHAQEVRMVALEKIKDQIGSGNVALCKLFCEMNKAGAENAPSPDACTCR